MESSLIWTGFLASLAAGVATGVGALPVFLTVRISDQVRDVMLGFAAGVMLAASAFSLIVPGLEAATEDYGGALAAALVVGCGILLGAVALWLINEHVPHEHFILGREGTVSTSLRRIWLFVIAITLHNFPEGLAVGSATAPVIWVGPTRRSASACRTCPKGSRWRSRWQARATRAARRSWWHCSPAWSSRSAG